jgi:hypothetical protein
MKTFVSENWYKLMIGSSMLMASFGFMVHSVSPAYAEPDYLKESAALSSSNGSDAYNDGYQWVAYNGYAYQIWQSSSSSNGNVNRKLKLD